LTKGHRTKVPTIINFLLAAISVGMLIGKQVSVFASQLQHGDATHVQMPIVCFNDHIQTIPSAVIGLILG